MSAKIIVIFILGAVAGISGFYYFQASQNLSAKEAGQLAMNFINEAVEKDNVTASLVNIKEESGIYKFRLKIAEQEYESYISKDGKYLFSTAFNLKAAQEERERQTFLDTTSTEVLATCLTEKGAKFYGTFWCEHCKNQKEMFGEDASSLPYIECSAEDGKTQLGVCKDNNITSYPTWEFADGSRETGEVSLEKLAEKSGCSLAK